MKGSVKLYFQFEFAFRYASLTKKLVLASSSSSVVYASIMSTLIYGNIMGDYSSSDTVISLDGSGSAVINEAGEWIEPMKQRLWPCQTIEE
ncbi:hypothetical protein L1887_37720 [Cichorium endivia]|nr:hypothetical protein L1887_37720 [Cichorium endivia]